MERPIRSFELVSDVQASWNKDKMVNYLVLGLTPLTVPLNRSAIPSIRLLILVMLNGKLNVETGVNDGWFYENIVSGYPNVIMEETKFNFILYPISMRIKLQYLNDLLNLLLSLSNQRINCRFSKIRLIIFIRLLIRKSLDGKNTCCSLLCSFPRATRLI